MKPVLCFSYGYPHFPSSLPGSLGLLEFAAVLQFEVCMVAEVRKALHIGDYHKATTLNF